ncbi:hypothetical protein Tco_0905584 [Tanacetum coccineum]
MVTMEVWCGGDGSRGDEMRVVVSAGGGGCGSRRGEKRRVAASGGGDRVDPVVRIIFGFGRKSPPENFSGDGGVVAGVIRVKQKQLNLGVGTERMIFHIDSMMKQSYSNDDICFSIDVIDEILEEDFDALLDEGSEILHSIEGTILEEKLFDEFNEFMAMIADENSKSESDTEEPPFEKITFKINYKIKTSLEEPPKTSS